MIKQAEEHGSMPAQTLTSPGFHIKWSVLLEMLMELMEEIPCWWQYEKLIAGKMGVGVTTCQEQCVAMNIWIIRIIKPEGTCCPWRARAQYSHLDSFQFLAIFEDFSKCFHLFYGQKNILFQKVLKKWFSIQKNRKYFYHFLGGQGRGQTPKWQKSLFLKPSLNDFEFI